ncbi:MAG TPA: hypothetical protein VM818_19555 [Vicinamibacterales bacterium]|nr:hypothetical protein [Vicinamibacterales bacterium]
MGDSGEGLIDAEARIQERIDEMERARAQRHTGAVRDPERVQALESLRLARTELERQLVATTHERRRVQIQEALAELDRRMTEASAAL